MRLHLLVRERELRKIEEDRRQRAEDEAIKKLDDPAERQRLQVHEHHTQAHIYPHVHSCVRTHPRCCRR